MRAARFMVRSTAGALLAAAVPRLAAVGLLWVEADAMVNGRWDLVSAELRARPSSEAIVAALVAGFGLAVLESRALASIGWGRQHQVVRRQPLSPAAYGLGLWALTLPFVAPLAAWGALWHGSAWGALLWSLPVAFAAVAASGGAWGVALLASGVGAVVVGLADEWPSLGLPLAAGSLGWVPGMGHLWRSRDLPIARVPRSLRVPLPHPILALVHRDVLAVVRTAPWLLAGVVLAALPVGFVTRNLALHGDVGPRGLTWGALGSLAAVSGLALAVPAAAARAVGAQFDPPRWPLRLLDRAAALVVVAGVTLVPSWAAAAVAGPIDAPGHLRIAGYVLDLAVGSAWWVASRPQRPGFGSWPWWAAVCLVPAAFEGGGVAAVVAAGAGLAALRALQVGRT